MEVGGWELEVGEECGRGDLVIDLVEVLLHGWTGTTPTERHW